MKKLWLFGTYAWQGNPKALFLYMQKNKQETHETWWIAENQAQADIVGQLGYTVAVADSKLAESLFARADAYIIENFRESSPASLNPKANIINLWHGVGLKHVEFAVGEESGVAGSIARKYIRNYAAYKRQIKFLVTSKPMADHFVEDMLLDEGQLIKGGYPRNVVYQDSKLATFDHSNIDGFRFDDYDRIILFAPTWRFTTVNGSVRKLLPNLDKLIETMAQTNSLFVIKVHPFMLKDMDYLRIMQEYKRSKNIMFWNDANDIYEVFNQIDIAVVDYSSIFYDLLEAGVEKFVRYIPDYEAYVNDSELIGDYYEYTDGAIATSFGDLIATLGQDVPVVSKKQMLSDHFFAYAAGQTVETLIEKIDEAQVREIHLKELHTFDIFDTLIRRNTLVPVSIFEKVQQLLKQQTFVSELDTYLVNNYPLIRRQVELDVRDAFLKTTFERDTDKIEVTLEDILRRLQNDYSFSEEVYTFLYNAEVKLEIEAVQPIQERIDYLVSLIESGQEVYLVSDMYLPEDVVRQMVIAADARLAEIPLYLSSSVGYQKSTGKLFTHIFFDRKYSFKSWTHYGDNKHADGAVPRRFGIQTVNHDMDTFTNFEAQFIKTSVKELSYDSYRVATMLQRYRWKQVSRQENSFNRSQYYAYAYIGTAFVPYINWAIKDALKRGYKTLYFISRDGYYLKQIADVLIDEKQYPIKTKYIYGSRKAWRVPSFITEVDAETFSPFGLFTNMDNFEELVAASQLDEKELLQLIPEIEGYRNESTLKGNIAIGIREIFERSTAYRERLLEIAEKRRPIVKEYLQQEINFEEKFAFVEFWGRGYTQDTFTRLLHDAAESELDDPYYYVRNYTPDFGKSIRHRFTTKNANFAYFEPIFATTPYTSIRGYEKNDKGIVPIVEAADNEFHEFITVGLQDFARDYSRLNLASEDEMDRQVSETSYSWQFSMPHDENIASVFSAYKYNESSYGEPMEYAPILTLKQVKDAETAEELRRWTRNIRMSLARSSQQVRDFWNKKQKISIPGMARQFPVNALNNYVSVSSLPAKALLLREQPVYQSVDWSANSKYKQTLPQFSIVEVLGVDWTKSLVPRLRLANGYITAHKSWVTILDTERVFEAGVKLVSLQKLTLFTLNDNQEFVADGSIQPNKVLTVLGGESVDNNVMIRTNIGWIVNNQNAFEILSDVMFANVSLLGRDVINTTEVERYRFYQHVNSLISMPALPVGQILKLKGFVKVGARVLIRLSDGSLISSEVQQLIKLDVVPRKDIDNYHILVNEEQDLLALKNIGVYDNLDIEHARKIRTISKFETFSAESVVWTDGGTPRLRVKDGYVTANRQNVGLSEDYDETLQQIKADVNEAEKLLNHLVISLETGEIFTPVELVIDKTSVKLTDGQRTVDLAVANKVRQNYQDFLFEGTFSKVEVLKKVARYTNTDFTADTKTIEIFDVGSTVEIQGIAWTKGGTPRLIVEHGYISANKENVKVVE